MGLSLDVPAASAANFSTLDLAVPVIGNFDFMNLTAGQAVSFTPLITGIYSLIIVATAVPPEGVFPQAQVNFDVAYTDNAGLEYNDDVVQILDDLKAENISESIYALTSANITVNSSYVTFGVAGAKPANSWQVAVTLGGTGTAAYGATLHQTTSGATAFYYASGINLGGVPGFMLYTVLTGVDDGTDKWTDPVSGQTFTPTAPPVVNTFTGAGFGVNMVQFVSGAFGLEMGPASGPTTVMHLGPHVSGVPDIPSGYIDLVGPAPSTTHNYAWYDPVNGGVFVPTAAWTDVATRVVFPYNEHVRVTLIG